ncbi:MAG: hypothetical protein J5772_07090 [Clostridia bacterium]|nr:hypothetical protein [Clostridia bacterium]
MTNKSYPYAFAKLPENLTELMALPGSDLKDPYAVAAFTIAALDLFPKNKDASIEMLNYIKGPRPLVPMDISFIKDRFMDGVDYVPRSYFEGTSPQNDYTPSVPYTVNVLELAHSRDQISEGYLKLFLRSSGADSERYLVLRHKPSTDQWFLWSFEGVMSGIRIPVSKDDWA